MNNKSYLPKRLRPKLYIFFFLLFLLRLTATGQNIEFIENKGQWDPQVKYKGEVSAGAFFVHQDGFTIVQHDPADWKRLNEFQHLAQNRKGQMPDIVLHSHAYRMRFLNAKASPQIIADKPLFTYNNYFIGNDPSKWGVRCKIFQGITLKNIYPNVDVRYYSNNGTLKYDLVVNPGADVNDIALKYEGADNLQVQNKELVIGTSVGKLKELAPYSYQYKENGKNEISVKYVVKDNIVRFNIKNYDASVPLVIDPSIIFCSFTGSKADNWGFTATYGPDGSMFGGGIVFSAGFPVTTGSYQTTFAGGNASGFGAGFDIGIMKLSPDGSSRIYATYLGGTGNEMPQSLITDDQGELIIAGRSNSPDYPTTSTLIGPGGSFDITLTKLSAAGDQLIGSRRIGGTSDDGANISAYSAGTASSLQQNYGDEGRSEVNLDGAGNIYLASCTQSTNFPVIGGFQSGNGGGTNKQDGVVLKFDPSLSTALFSTYLGGNGNDAAYVVSVNPFDGNIYVAGGTESSNLPGTGSGFGSALTPSGNSSVPIDGFVSIISSNGSALIKTIYLGTSGIDQVYGVQFDNNGFVYVMGQTTGSWPIVNATWSQAKGKQFIAKLQSDLSAYVYSTVFGKGGLTPDISPVAFLVDRCENVYISGWGDGPNFHGNHLGSYGSMGTSGLTTTPDAFQTSTDDGDFYFFVLKKDATAQLFGSFFGEAGGEFSDHVDGGTSRFDKNGIIYQGICANCYSTGFFPTTPGVWAPLNGTNPRQCNLAMLKVNLDLSGVRGHIQSSINGVIRDTSGCVPLPVDFKDTIQVATKYEWNFGDGSPQVQTASPSVSHTYNSLGIFHVMMIAIDSSKCFPRDTSYLNIKVSDLKAQLAIQPIKLLPCTSNSYMFLNLSQAPAARPYGPASFIWDFGDGSPKVTTDTNRQFHSYASPGTYVVKLILNDTGYCNYPVQIADTLRVASTVKASFNTPPTGCAPYNAQLTNTSQGGAQFFWDFGDGTTSTNSSPTHTFIAGTYIISMTAIDSATCNIIDSTKITITVFDNPTSDFSAAPQPPVSNTPITFTNLASLDAIRFKWEFGDGDSLITTSRANVLHEYNTSSTFNACLTAYNQAGCSAKMCRQVTTLVVPAVDVPNAFTPLSGGVNGVIYVRGYGIAKMKFTVWARWGDKVFETEDKHVGWDGKLNGKLLPMDVYAYTLDVQFTDGTTVRKKGDITLIR